MDMQASMVASGVDVVGTGIASAEAHTDDVDIDAVEREVAGKRVLHGCAVAEAASSEVGGKHQQAKSAANE